MKFMMGGETGWAFLERMTYDGAIGIFYNNTIGGIVAFLIFVLMCILSLIGLISVFKWLFGRKKKKSKKY